MDSTIKSTCDEMIRRREIDRIKSKMQENDDLISTYRARNTELTIRLIGIIHGVAVGDVVRSPNGTEYKVCGVHPRVLLLSAANLDRQVRPWITGYPHTKDGIGWDTKQEINLYGNWERVS